MKTKKGKFKGILKETFSIKTMKSTGFILIGLYGLSIGFFGSMIYRINKTLPSIKLLEEYSPKATKIFDRNGRLIREIYEERRTLIPIEKIPKPIIQTTIAIEDRKFYNHCGIDLFGIIRAAIANILKLEIVQGGSTITQQLARNLFLTPERKILRKIKEIMLAIKIEKYYSKEEILELYFNQIYYGNGVYGIETAAQYYFKKPVYKLTPAEWAVLIAIPQSPVRYNPYADEKLCKKRASIVLNKMKEILPEKEIKKAKIEKINIEKKPNERIASYYIEEIKKWINLNLGPDLLYRGGATIYTTLDIEMQKIAEKAVQDGIKKLEEKYKIKDGDLQAALIAMDVRTGEILAEVGGKDFAKSMFNRACQAKRQPGSAFKPFVWATALENGFNVSSIIEDEPITIRLETGQIYSPRNYDGKFFGPVTLRKGIAESRNLVSVRLITKVGPEKVVEYGKRLGIKSKLEPYIALSLGCNDVTLLELVSAYNVFANQGIRVNPFRIKSVVSEKGKILYENQEIKEQVISPQIAYIMTSLMESVLNEGTGAPARLWGFNDIAAGKTGTTDECYDAWFIGYTPSIICGVWVGFDELRRIGKQATGAVCALPIWTEFMKQVANTQENFIQPEGIVIKKICNKCGKLAPPSSNDTRDEVFIKDTEPKEYCHGHIL